jgi:hypothetical protein
MSVAWGGVEMTGYRRPNPSERSEDNQTLVAPVISAPQHARHRPSHSGARPRAKMSVAWGGVEMTGYRRPNPSERSEDNQTLLPER